MLNNIKQWVVSRYRRCDQIELEQSLVRLGIGVVILGYVSFRYLKHSEATYNDVVAFAIVGVFLALSVFITFSILYRPVVSVRRRLLGAWVDQGSSTLFLIFTGEAGILLVCVYLWVIFGNGFRFGNKYLFHAQVLALGGFLAATYINPYWRQHEIVAYGVVLMLTALPIYVSALTKRMNEARKKAEEASALKTQFVAVMSHEIRTPLNGIVGISTLLKTTHLTPEQKDLMTTLDSSSKLLLSLLNNVLDFAKIEEGKLTVEHTSFQLADLVHDTTNVFKNAAEAKHLSLTCNADDQDLNCLGDRHKLQQVITNLVGNAIKFTERGSIVFSVRTLEKLKDKCTLRFEIVDTGIGIPETKQKSIFDSFTQADASTTRKFGGSGLGLTISKHIIEAMGGEIQCASQEGIGTRFWFDLQFDIGHGVAQEAEQHKPVFTLMQAKQQIRRLNVLICEDDATNQKILQKLIELLHHQVTVVNNGDEMLDLLEEQSFDLVISDLNMAGMTGIDALKTYRFIKPEDKHTRFILFTADATLSTRNEANNAGFDAFLSKPVDADTLFETIARLFDMPLVTTESLAHEQGLVQIDKATPSISEDEVLDMQTLKELEFLGGNDPLFVHRLLKNYLADSEALLNNIVKAVEQKRYGEAQELCHALKGNSLSVGARRVFEQTEAIEKAAPSLLRFRGAAMIGQLKIDFDAVRSSVEHYLSRRQTASL